MSSKNIHRLLGICLIFCFAACHKKNGTDASYWIAREAGAYSVSAVHHVKYADNTLLEENELLVGNCTFILKSIEGEGSTCYLMDIYGAYLPQFLNVLSTGLAWTLEYDKNRISFGYFDPNIGYVPAATLTVENITKSKQKWHYVKSYTLGGKDVYEHDTYEVERK